MGNKVKENKTVTVSVIIPVYNAAEHIRECLNVVCNQSLENYEVICVDDCSTDNSVDILREYQKTYSMLKVIRQPENAGAGPARNRGMKAARGKYIAFMDADDYYQHKDTLKRLFEQAAEAKADICGGGMRYADTIKKKDSSQYCFQDEGWVDFKDYQQYYYYQRFIFSRALILNHDIFFPDYMRFQDPPFFVKAMVTAGKFYAISDIVYVYREDGAHVTWNERKVNDLMQGHMDVLKLCMENNLNLLLYDMLKRDLENDYLHTILEKSLSDGNVKVADFFHFVLNCTNHVLIKDMPPLKLKYAQTIDAWNRQVNMRFFHRPIALADKVRPVTPSVSVIIPVYNTEQYISSCIDSILAQSQSNIEIICIDDGSTDNGGLILDEYERRYDHVRVYHQKNQGLSAARNAGLQHAQGEYVYFMDSDDLLQEQALEVLYKQAKENDLDVLFFGAASFFDDDVSEQQKKNNRIPMEYRRKGEYPPVLQGGKMLCQQHKNNDFFTSVCIQMTKLSFLRENNIAFYETLLHEDNLYTLQLLMKAQRTGCIDEMFFQRRIRKDSIMTAQTTHRNILGLYLTITELMREFNDLPVQSAEYQMLIEKMQLMLLNNLSWKWKNLAEVEKTLFFASLTREDRMMFNALVMPTNILRQQLCANAGKPKVQQPVKAASAAEVSALKQEVAALRSSWAYRIGCKLTWVPHQMKKLVSGRVK